MTYKDNIKAILECNFAGFKDEIIDTTCNRILEIELDPCDTCGYVEGSIYCKEHCPHEAKIKQEPCDNAISRQAALDEIRKCRFVVDAIEKIRGLPPVSSQPKTGHWIEENSVLICSICDARVARYDKYSYCPNCGAKMIELKER